MNFNAKKYNFLKIHLNVTYFYKIINKLYIEAEWLT